MPSHFILPSDRQFQKLNSVLDPDPHKEMPPGSGFAWTDADPDPGGIQA